MQLGGSDQWGNITAGIDLIRRRRGAPAYGLTWPLVTGSDGQKMGKSVGGALWLDPARTSPYQFHQYWLQIPDDDAERYLPKLTFRPVADIEELLASHAKAPERRVAQRALADDVTTLVHGGDASRAAAEAAEVLFGGDPLGVSAAALDTLAGEIPTSRVEPGDVGDVVELLVTTELATSKSDARRLLQQGGVRANDHRLGPDDGLDAVALLHGRYLLLRKGKRSFHLVQVSEYPG
jgi:tyrosyl-tRNA synthetase